MFEIFIVWLVMGFVVASIATEVKKRDFLPWFIYGFLIWPVALIHVLCISPPPEQPPPPKSNDETTHRYF